MERHWLVKTIARNEKPHSDRLGKHYITTLLDE